MKQGASTRTSWSTFLNDFISTPSIWTRRGGNEYLQSLELVAIVHAFMSKEGMIQSGRRDQFWQAMFAASVFRHADNAVRWASNERNADALIENLGEYYAVESSWRHYGF